MYRTKGLFNLWVHSGKDPFMTDNRRYEELASKWLNGTISEAEKAEFAAWYYAHRDDELSMPSDFIDDEESLRQRMLTNVLASVSYPAAAPRSTRRLRWLSGVAAAVALFASVGLYTWQQTRYGSGSSSTALESIRPGGNRATLTLADGRMIDLSEEHSGIIVADQVTYLDGTRLIENEGFLQSHRSTFNSISTPKGGTYRIMLPDGTSVWLNSASTLKYPSRFTADDRIVELAGEGYFSVAADKNKPFKVISKGQHVEVLGTVFNISAYADDTAIKTTLVEGSVRLVGDSAHVTVLRSGEQAVFTKNGFDVQQVDTAEFTAWKDGYFYFNDADIYTVMKQFERWYDIEVRYEINSRSDLFVGKIPRDVDLAAALNILKSTGVNVELDGRMLVILPGSN